MYVYNMVYDMMPLKINCIPVSKDVLVSVSAGTLGVNGMVGVAYKKKHLYLCSTLFSSSQPCFETFIP